MIVTKEIKATIGATTLEADLLNFLADTLTKNNPSWLSSVGDGSGAWGVSQKWYGVLTPRDSVQLQAAQALEILREMIPKISPLDDWPGKICYYSAVLKLWWYPAEIAKILEWKDTHDDQYPSMDNMHWSKSEAVAWFGVYGQLIESVKENWIWWAIGTVGLAIGIYLLARK